MAVEEPANSIVPFHVLPVGIGVEVILDVFK